MKLYLPLFCFVVLAGCAPENQIQPRTAANEAGMICTRERPTGSSIAKRVCRPKNSNDAATAQRMVEQSNRAGGQGIAAGR